MSNAPVNRTSTGRFQPGMSGNPKGRPKGITELRAELSQYVPAVNSKLLEIIQTGKPNEVIEAIKIFYDRVFGKPVLTQDVVKDHFTDVSKEQLVQETEELLKAVKAA